MLREENSIFDFIMANKNLVCRNKKVIDCLFRSDIDRSIDEIEGLYGCSVSSIFDEKKGSYKISDIEAYILDSNASFINTVNLVEKFNCSLYDMFYVFYKNNIEDGRFQPIRTKNDLNGFELYSYDLVKKLVSAYPNITVSDLADYFGISYSAFTSKYLVSTEDCMVRNTKYSKYYRYIMVADYIKSNPSCTKKDIRDYFNCGDNVIKNVECMFGVKVLRQVKQHRGKGWTCEDLIEFVKKSNKRNMSISDIANHFGLSDEVVLNEIHSKGLTEDEILGNVDESIVVNREEQLYSSEVCLDSQNVNNHESKSGYDLGDLDSISKSTNIFKVLVKNQNMICASEDVYSYIFYDNYYDDLSIGNIERFFDKRISDLFIIKSVFNKKSAIIDYIRNTYLNDDVIISHLSTRFNCSAHYLIWLLSQYDISFTCLSKEVTERNQEEAILRYIQDNSYRVTLSNIVKLFGCTYRFAYEVVKKNEFDINRNARITTSICDKLYDYGKIVEYVNENTNATIQELAAYFNKTYVGMSNYLLRKGIKVKRDEVIPKYNDVLIIGFIKDNKDVLCVDATKIFDCPKEYMKVLYDENSEKITVYNNSKIKNDDFIEYVLHNPFCSVKELHDRYGVSIQSVYVALKRNGFIRSKIDGRKAYVRVNTVI